MEILGYDFSDYDLAKQVNPPKLVVKRWSSDKSITLSPEYDEHQTVYENVASTEDYCYRWYEESDFQEMADEFNNDPDLKDEWSKYRKLAVKNLIDYSIREEQEAKNDIQKYKKLLKELSNNE